MSQRIAVAAFAAVTVVVLAAALILASSSAASTPREAEHVLWYLRGQSQIAFEPRGRTTQALGCRPTSGRFVYCWIRVYMPEQRASFCAHALYRATGDAIVGKTSKPKRCGGSEKRKGPGA